MEKDLEKHLKILNDETCLKRPKDALPIIDKISKYFTTESSQIKVGILMTLVFDENEGILNFIWKASASSETLQGVSAAFKFLDHLVMNFQNCTKSYFPVLYEKCICLLGRNFARVKELSLKLIKNIISAQAKHAFNLSGLVLKLEKILREESKIGSTVIEQIYILLGYLFEKYPECVKNEKWFLGEMIHSLKHETASKDPSVSVVKGAFEGINGYLKSHQAPNEETLKNMYECIKEWSKYREDKKLVSRSGMKIIQNHWKHFYTLINADIDYWTINLDTWINQKKEDREAAFKCLCSIYSVIALIVKKELQSSVAKQYINEFNKCLEDSDANPYRTKAALVGIKIFTVTDCLPSDYFNQAYDHVTSFIRKEEKHESFSYLPLCIECLSAFILKSSNDDLELLTFLQRLSVKLIECYPRYEKELKEDAHIALEKSFYMMGVRNLHTTETHLERILYQGLTRTCSSITFVELELLVETGQSLDSLCYKSFIGLWKYLLTLANSPILPVGGSFAIKKEVAGKVLDAFIVSFIRIVTKLDFSVGNELEVDKPSDLHIFINIVDLYGDVMSVVDSSSVQKWFIHIFRTVIPLSYTNPLLSGFYKIMEINLKLADSVQFFNDDATEKCFELVRKYLEDILTKVDHYKGELQVACLKVFLAAPISVVESLAERTIPALEVVAQLARNSVSLLNDLLETLERWDLYMPSETSEKILGKILPLLDIFFQSPYFRGRNSVDSSRGGRNLKVEVLFEDSELLTLQKKFLMFLGSMHISKGKNLLEVPDSEQRRKISDKHLVYALPCGRGCIELNLDEMVLRVVQLAESCGDRGTRITACELLYSLFLIIVGNINQLSGGYTFLFRKVARTCLMLGCDSDGLVSQMFEPLMYQIVHYFSGKQALHFSETGDLIDILMDCVTCPYNPSVRDLSGDLLREFTVWSIKQLSPEELKMTPESMERILRKIHSLALHPSYSKRLGAAVIFNKIYLVLREEDFIVNSYWFQLFYHFMESLRMCEDSEEVSEIIKVIRHLQIPLMEKRKEFNKDFPERVVPPEFKGGRLCHLVRWTMERACDLKAATRHTAMSLVQELAPFVENCDLNMSYSNKQLLNFFQFKRSTHQLNLSKEEYTNWLKYQYAGFEYCSWLLERGVLTTEEVFQPKLKAVLKCFMSTVLSSKESDVDGQQEAILAFLKLLFNLKERACIFLPEYWDLLKIGLLRPSKLGFDLENTSSATEKLLSVLIDLFKYISDHMTNSEWENFYKNQETLTSLPAFSQISRSKYVNISSWEFLFTLKVINGAGAWNLYGNLSFFSVNGDFLIFPIFKSLFLKRGQTTYAVVLEPTCKLYFEEVLKIILTPNTNIKGLMKLLEDEEEVKDEETEKIIKKGKYFLSVFKNVVLRFLESKPEELVEWALRQGDSRGVKLLIHILENQSNHSDLALKIFTSWQDFENLALADTKDKDSLLLRLALCCAPNVRAPEFLKTSPIADKIYAILESRKLEEMQFSELDLVFSLLPYFCVFSEGVNDNDRLSKAFSRIEIDACAVKKSTDLFKKNRIQFAMNGILKSLKATASLVILNFVMKKASWFKTFCEQEEIESALSVFTSSVDALELAYDYCFTQEPSEFVCLVVHCKMFMDPLMKMASSQAVFKLVNEHLSNLCTMVGSSWGDNKAPLHILREMTRKISAARILQTFITKLPKEELYQMSKEKRQMIEATVKNVFFFLKKPYPPRILKECYRKLMCEIFNMICCIVSAYCVEEKFYKLFIFDDRGSFLFEVTDKNLSYKLDMDFEELPERRKHLTVLREEMSPPSFGRDSVKYIQTNTLFTSSLQDEVTRFDLTYSFLRPVNSAPERTKNVEIELEMDVLNSHECMATLVATISKMVRDKITPVSDVNEVPCWLKFFLTILKNSDLSENLRLFVLKAIYNVQEFVVPFSKKIFPELLDAILKLFVNYPMNYFLMDLIEMMIGWRHVPENEKAQAQLTELVEIVLEKSDNLRRAIVKFNLEILKLMIEVWKDAMELPNLSRFVFERLSKSVEDDLKTNTNADSVTYLNAHACGILLSNGIPAWDEDCEGKFFSLILKGFREGNKHNELLGQISGQALNHIARTKPNSLENWELAVRDKIDGLPTWLQTLYAIHKHYPKMASLFTFRIFSSAWDSKDSLTVKKLELLLSIASGSEPVEDPTFQRHVSIFIIDMLNSADPEIQEYTCRIAEKLLHKMHGEKLQILMKEAVRLQCSVRFGVRKAVYEIAKKLYGIAPVEVFPDCKIILLRGLNDGTKELENYCLKFWRDILNTTSPEIALPEILNVMYCSDTEDIFLSNAARVLLHLSDDDYHRNKELFPHPITHRCKFQKRNLVRGVRQSFLLNLATSKKSLANQSLETLATISQHNLPYLRPSISTLQFQPTIHEEVEPGVCVAEKCIIPKNPHKRRFHKGEENSFSFAKWRDKKKKQGEKLEKKKDDVDILCEYRDGDYPDIQIKHSQMMQLLEALARKDQQIARLFLVSFYSGLVEAIGTEQREVLYKSTKNHFENIIKTSKNFDPGMTGFVLEVILKHSKSLDIDYQLVSDSAVSSNCVSLGALIMEQIISNEEGEEAPTAGKKRKGYGNPEERRWLELARLYRGLEEIDVVLGIFLDKMKVLGNAKEAVRCESVWNWADASKNYELALRSGSDVNQMEFYTESYLSCLGKLSNWSGLNSCIRQTVKNDLDELWNNYYLLSWFLRSEMMLSLGTGRDEFRTVVEEFCKNQARRNILDTNFGEEMTAFDWFSNNFQRANSRIDKLCLDFLAGWSHLDQWSHSLRAARLASLQTLSELSFAVGNLSEVSRSQMEHNFHLGVKRWEKSMPTPRDELCVWDVKLGYRREYLRRLKELDFDVTALDVRANLSLAKAALSQENLCLTRDCLSRAKEKLPEVDFDLKAEHHIYFNMGKLVAARLKMKDPKVGLDIYVKVWDGISKQISTGMETDSESTKTLLYSCYFTSGQLVAEILPFLRDGIAPPEVLEKISNKLKSSEENVLEALQKTGVSYFESAISILEKIDSSRETKSTAYLELCQYFLKFPGASSFERLCEYLLKCMSLGNEDARELFGCLLNMSQLADESSLGDVVTLSESVPSWMFLRWINQMLARLNSKMFPLLRELLLRITQTYPNAIRYALKLTEEVKLHAPKVNSFVNHLCGIVSNDKLYVDFWNAVQFLAPPDLILSHYLQDALQEASQLSPDFIQIKQLISHLQQLMFSTDYATFRGPVFKFWETFQDPIQDLLSDLKDAEVVKQKIKKVLSSVKNSQMPSKRVLGLLESYSPWLYNFHALKADGNLELPGQYDGGLRPLEKYLVKVSSFRNSVVVFDSKCRPMRISVLGNDASEHKFLVKFGEDLRQDERIQQVFCHFNHRLKETKQSRRFCLDRYKVVPFTSNLGLIEWVEDTVSLHEMLENGLGNDSDAIVKAQGAHLKFLSMGSLVETSSLSAAVAAHLTAYESMKRETVISNFRATAQRFPRDLLKKAFLDLSTSPEHFMHLRGNFAVSHAITCITHWLVGIGDRHLQNTLVCTKTGRVLGIDFGYAFGFATQFLTPPELLPFRLSPQILNVMHPLGESGWIKQTMIHSLRVFRKESFRLRSVLEVFAEEPVVNWLKQVKKNPKYQAENDTWYPREKLELVEKKLEGANPVTTFEADLRAGHSQSKYLPKYLEVLRGIPRENFRARCREGGLSEEEQVECLIDLATDPHVLGKTYIGWNPWL